MKKPATPKLPKLPEGILVADTKYPDNYKDHAYDVCEHGQFKMHYTERFGWVIATLYIRGTGRTRSMGRVDRTYAVTLKGEACRVGLGPHVKHTVTVYVRKSRMKALQKYIDLYNSGNETANDIRDSISTKRARTAARRGRSWMDF